MNNVKRSGNHGDGFKKKQKGKGEDEMRRNIDISFIKEQE